MLAHGGSLEPDYWPLQGGAEVEGLTPVRLELGSSAWGDTGGSEGSEERPHGHNVGHKGGMEETGTDLNILQVRPFGTTLWRVSYTLCNN